MTEKEIGIGKLMGYVEEMQKEGINICRPRFQEYYLLEMMLVSKHYGLIQRLVEQDKINITKSKIDELPAMYAYDYDSVECKTDRLLMILAISEQPIDLLISILK